MELYNSIVEGYQAAFIQEFGDRKLRKIREKVHTSKSVEKAFKKLETLDTYPGSQDVVSTVMNIPFFMFAKKEYIEMGSILFLKKWNDENNLKSYYLDESELITLHNRIKHQCQQL